MVLSRRRLGRSEESRAAYDRAIALAGNTAETAYLIRRRDQLAPAREPHHPGHRLSRIPQQRQAVDDPAAQGGRTHHSDLCPRTTTGTFCGSFQRPWASEPETVDWASSGMSPER
jgi:hypothetical protein